MSGKDLLAVLAMIAPSFLLIALIAIASIPPSNTVAAPPAKKDADPQVGAKRVSEPARCNSSARDDDHSC